MIIFVDYEHADRYKDGGGSNIQAARTWISYRLEDMAHMPCLLVRWDRITSAPGPRRRQGDLHQRQRV